MVSMMPLRGAMRRQIQRLAGETGLDASGGAIAGWGLGYGLGGLSGGDPEKGAYYGTAGGALAGAFGGRLARNALTNLRKELQREGFELAKAQTQNDIGFDMAATSNELKQLRKQMDAIQKAREAGKQYRERLQGQKDKRQIRNHLRVIEGGGQPTSENNELRRSLQNEMQMSEWRGPQQERRRIIDKLDRALVGLPHRQVLGSLSDAQLMEANRIYDERGLGALIMSVLRQSPRWPPPGIQ